MLLRSPHLIDSPLRPAHALAAHLAHLTAGHSTVGMPDPSPMDTQLEWVRQLVLPLSAPTAEARPPCPDGRASGADGATGPQGSLRGCAGASLLAGPAALP